ncbi:MAG: hypothetical protein EP330_25640 [Deltaproteobacteria bacterium]|nr:MAG: hypothetical protein EP330_25640 [Deltaproteobacteria bacterium]
MSRGPASVGFAAAILGLGLVWWAVEDRVSAPELGSPNLAAGAEVILPIGRVVAVDGELAQLRKEPEVYTVRGEAAFAVGEEWTVGGTWTGDSVELAWAVPHPDRGGKKWLGGLGLVLVLGALARGVRGRPGRMTLRG